MMDAKKFGSFIATVRKEKHMTQTELAEKLHVTDKAVSKWERGMGFPDINSIEPLADALGISIVELMRSEKSAETEIAQEDASVALKDTVELAKAQRREEKRAAALISGCAAAILFAVFLVDSMGWMMYALTYLPVVCLAVGAVLGVYGCWRRKKGRTCARTFALAAGLLAVPLLLTVLLFLAGCLGLGPVPN